MGVNSAGLRSKLTTFRKVLSELKPSIFFVEETKYKEVGKIKFENYIVFELVRKNKDGGGLAIGCETELQPVWLREGDDTVEALSVEIFVKKMKIRCCIAYGPQEDDLIERKEKFWTYIEEDVIKADESDSGFILHFDGNLWAGSQIITNDPRSQNRNGKLFHEFLQRNPHLTVVNSLPQCDGLVTRRRLCDGKVEESVLDFFVVCHRVLPYVTKMVIDERKKYVLTNYQQARYGGKAKDSDHFTQYMDLELDIISEKPERIEFYDFKKEESQKLFFSKTNEFTNCFNGKENIQAQVKNWRAVLNSFCKKSFKKIRVKKKLIKSINPSISNLINERNSISVLPNTLENEERINSINLKISDFEATENRDIIMRNFKKFSDNPENINMQEVWKLMKNLWPKTPGILPTAKRNHRGRIVTGPSEIRKLLSKEYKDRLRTRTIRPDLKSMKKRKVKIFHLKMKVAGFKRSKIWTMKDLEKALSDLKNNKCRDFEGFINEIFKVNVIGDNLKKSLLIMFNKLKMKKMIPSYFNFANITTVPKKGSRIEPRNERGIFRIPVARAILMRLLYNEKYPSIDKKMSDYQVGARKNRGCKDNIFIVNGIIHEAMKSKKQKPIVLQILDCEQMFDSIALKEALSDIFDTGVDDDALHLLYEANKNIHMAVKTPAGLTDRQVLHDNVLQGDTWGSILASVQVETIGKECMKEDFNYLYKDSLPVGFLSMVDDIIGISEAGIKSQMMNAFINLKTAEKGLRFGPSKCKSMLVGKNIENVITSDLYVDSWTVDYKENKETEEDDLIEQYAGQMPIGAVDEQRYLGFVLSSHGDNMVNIRHIKTSL